VPPGLDATAASTRNFSHGFSIGATVSFEGGVSPLHGWPGVSKCGRCSLQFS
jgi:hypothetical protein